MCLSSTVSEILRFISRKCAIFAVFAHSSLVLLRPRVRKLFYENYSKYMRYLVRNPYAPVTICRHMVQIVTDGRTDRRTDGRHVYVSIRPCVVNIFKGSETAGPMWHVYSVSRGTKLLGSGILNFGPCAARER